MFEFVHLYLHDADTFFFANLGTMIVGAGCWCLYKIAKGDE